MGECEENRGLRRELGLLDVFCIDSGAMISSGLFVLPGLAFAKAGPAVIIAYAIASLLVIPPMLSKAELGTAMPKAGGTYFFIDRSMGPMMGTVGAFILFGFGWYWFYARDKIWREYSLLHIIERVTGQKSTGYLVDEELREVLIDRDELEKERFENVIKNCEVIDLYKYLRPDKLALMLAEKLTKRIGIDIDKLYNLLKKKKKILI